MSLFPPEPLGPDQSLASYLEEVHLLGVLDGADSGSTRKRSQYPVDLRALEYVDSYDHNLVCLICHSPFVRPVTLECEHVFCNRCVTEAMFHQGQSLTRERTTCPTCRRQIGRPTATSVSRILTSILDELQVKCPNASTGCREIKPRGQIQDHVDKYCDYTEIECPAQTCILTVRRKDTQEHRCLHGLVTCEDCGLRLQETDVEAHRERDCMVRRASCPDCKAQVFPRDLEGHVKHCPEATLPCSAAQYGCDFIAKGTILHEHLKTCALAKLGPLLKMQNDRLEAHEAALRHLRHKNSVLEISFSAIQDTLNLSANPIDIPSSSAARSDTGPFDSPAHHLLCLHESLRDEVNRVSAAISEVDAKASMMVMNERLRVKEDFSHTNAAIAGMRMQLHWLMSARLQNQQRVAMVRTQSSGEGAGALSGSNSAGTSSCVELPVRRLSDSTRQDPKL